MSGSSPSRQPLRYDLRRDRRRILSLLFALGLVIIAIREAARPENWEWLTGPARPRPAVRHDPGSKGEPAPGRADDAPLAPGEFRVVHDEPVGTVPGENSRTAAAEAAPDRNTKPPRGVDLRIPQELLQPVRDQSVGIRSAEGPAYFAILAKARDVPLGVLEQVGRTDVSYAELINDPERHRGELITLEGELRRFTPLDPGENSEGFERLYDGWMFTNDAGPKCPYRIICSGKPAGLPEGESIRERVKFTGYFFKRCSYETARGLNSAPLLLGKEVRWTRPSPRSDDARSTSAYIVWALALLAAGFAGVFWWLSATDRKLRARTLRGVRASGDGSLEALRDIETTDPAAFLKGLGEKEAGGRSGGER